MNIIEVDSRATHEGALRRVWARCARPVTSSARAYLAIAEGSLLAVRSAGAYGFTMSSNYNTRPVRPRCWWTVTRRTSSESGSSWRIWRGEHLLP
jgi:diaminopimelate decarboxylase